jgi:hypothetical protein
MQLRLCSRDVIGRSLIHILGGCIGPTAVMDRFLETTIAAGEALLAKLVDLSR